MTRPIYEPTTQRQIRKQGFSADQLFRRPAPVSPEGDDSFDCCCTTPGANVLPMSLAERNHSPTFNWSPIRYPADVIAASLYGGTINGLNVATFSALAPSGRALKIVADTANDYDEALAASDHGWVFSPVDDFGCEPGAFYGIWFSFLYVNKDGAELHVEARSNNTVSDAEAYPDGNRHPNAGTTPSTLVWGDPANQTEEYPELGYYGMLPWGTASDYGDWPLQSGSNDGCGMSFAAGEIITVKAFSPDGTADVYLDHLVFMPTYPLGVASPTRLGDQDANFSSSALEVYGYEPTSSPASITLVSPVDGNPDYGTVFGDAMDDTQELTTIFDPDMHWTIASHDESDIAGLYLTAVTARPTSGGVHVYVLIRSRNEGAVYHPSWRGRGHATCMTASSPISDCLPPACGAWVWSYAGVMALGDGPQGSFGIIQWINDNEVFWNLNDDDITSVRSSLVAYLPQAPCEEAPDIG